MDRATTETIDEARWLQLERSPDETLRAALVRTLRDAILAGALREGVRLPASRTLARQIGASRGVVSDAYGQLEAQGFLVVRPRSAPVVAATIPGPTRRRRPAELTSPPPRFDLTPTTPDVTLFPLNRWLAAAQQVARRAGSLALDYREPRGERALREALADHLGRTRGVIADPEEIVVVQGTAQGVDLLLRVLRARGAMRIGVEDPSHTTQRERARALGFRLQPQPVDRNGMLLTGLEADAVLVTPAHQFPTGSVLSGERRRELLAWAEQHDGLIVEDDYDSEFRYDRAPVRALQGLAPSRVVHLGTVSKTLAPGLRLGWVVVPAELADEAAQTKRLLDDFSPSLDQLTLAELFRRGQYDRHLRRARGTYRRRRDRLLTALARRLPQLPIEGVAAGVHMLLGLPAGVNDVAISEAATRERIRVPPLSSFCVKPANQGGLVIGYGRLHESAVEPAARALAAVIRAHL
ncbi:MAG TPA: PLP-dependent aminotransferase family protein [Gaiellaceae bacterium]|nr:PLP-dependent aminotransferase family protein [Gaiellaceae bacterium]HET8653307.1 PLP-dependent aminotransferase family protein [Gaiellaceae bacterium]